MALRILIADDHDMVRETIAMFLDADGGTETVAASDLPEAMAKIEAEGPFDLVLLDYTMPGMKGLEALPKVMKANEEKPVGLISGTATRLIAEQALAMGAMPAMVKREKATTPALSVFLRFMCSSFALKHARACLWDSVVVNISQS